MKLTNGLGADPKTHQRIFDDFIAGKITYKESRTQLIGLWSSTGNANRKLKHFIAFAEKYHLSKDDCVVVGNGDSDIALFRELKYGVASNAEADSELERLAFRKISKLHELKGIL